SGWISPGFRAAWDARSSPAVRDHGRQTFPQNVRTGRWVMRRSNAGRMWWNAGRILACVCVGVVSATRPVPAKAPLGDVTFTKDVLPILQRSCQNCHRTNSIAPMPLLTYEQVRPWASAIKRQTAAREMPPWYIEKIIGIQKFKNDPSLSDEEIA